MHDQRWRAVSRVGDIVCASAQHTSRRAALAEVAARTASFREATAENEYEHVFGCNYGEVAFAAKKIIVRLWQACRSELVGRDFNPRSRFFTRALDDERQEFLVRVFCRDLEFYFYKCGRCLWPFTLSAALPKASSLRFHNKIKKKEAHKQVIVRLTALRRTARVLSMIWLRRKSSLPSTSLQGRRPAPKNSRHKTHVV
jgi:hypothetical protein